MEPIQDLFPVAARLVRTAPLSDGKVACAWRLAVGANLGRVSRARLSADGTVHVEVDDARWRKEIERARTLILERVQQLLGADVARKIVLHAPAGGHEPPPPRPRRRGLEHARASDPD